MTGAGCGEYRAVRDCSWAAVSGAVSRSGDAVKGAGWVVTRREAEAFIATVIVATGRGECIDPQLARATAADLGPTWLAAQIHLKPSSYGVLESAWRVYVEPRWGEVESGRVRHSEVQLWVKALAEGTAPSVHPKHALGATSVIRAYGILASILDLAVLDRRLTVNPARGVHLPRKHGKRHAYLSHQQVELLAQCAKDEGTLIRFLCYTGLRWGGAVALHVRDVDLIKRRVSVVENAVRVGGKIIVGTPKSHHARRVPVPEFLAYELAVLSRGRAGGDLVFGDGRRHLRQPTMKGGWWVQVVARAQELDPTFPRPTIHDLRHTAASLAVSAGANVKAVQRVLGHASAAMTLDVYADLFDEDLESVATALDDARRDAGVGTGAQEAVGFLWRASHSPTYRRRPMLVAPRIGDYR